MNYPETSAPSGASAASLGAVLPADALEGVLFATMLTVEQVREALDYDPETGVLRWKEKGKKRVVGGVVGSTHREGYLETCVNRERHLCHRLIWLMVYGRWPNQVDHINGNKQDNRLCNLRESDFTHNARAFKSKRKSASIFRGVTWAAGRGKWFARIHLGDGSAKFLGYCPTEKLAAMAYDRAVDQFGFPEEAKNFK